MASTSEDLFASIQSGQADRVRVVLGSSPELAISRDAEGVSALMRARYRFDDDLVDAIMPLVPELDLFEAASFGDEDRLAELLAGDPSSVTSLSGDGFTALHLAAFFGQTRAAASLVEGGADVDAPGRGWMTGTALHSATSAGDAAVVEGLLEAGADPNARQAGGWTPLHAAAHNGDTANIVLLLAAGGDARAVPDDGTSVLEMAERSGVEAAIAAIESALLL